MVSQRSIMIAKGGGARRGAARGGFTLVEAMMLLVIFSIIAVAAGVGLQAVVKVPATADLRMAVNAGLMDTLEQWKVKSWAAMNPSSPYATPYTITDTVTVNNLSYSRTVTVADADPSSPGSGTAVVTDFRKITVTYTLIQNGSPVGTAAQTMRCYVTKP